MRILQPIYINLDLSLYLLYKNQKYFKYFITITDKLELAKKPFHATVPLKGKCQKTHCVEILLLLSQACKDVVGHVGHWHQILLPKIILCDR